MTQKREQRGCISTQRQGQRRQRSVDKPPWGGRGRSTPHRSDRGSTRCTHGTGRDLVCADKIIGWNFIVHPLIEGWPKITQPQFLSGYLITLACSGDKRLGPVTSKMIYTLILGFKKLLLLMTLYICNIFKTINNKVVDAESNIIRYGNLLNNHHNSLNTEQVKKTIRSSLARVYIIRKQYEYNWIFPRLLPARHNVKQWTWENEGPQKSVK